jgi:hypothetical protein
LFGLFGFEELKSSIPVFDGNKNLLGRKQDIYVFVKEGKQIWHN